MCSAHSWPLLCWAEAVTRGFWKYRILTGQLMLLDYNDMRAVDRSLYFLLVFYALQALKFFRDKCRAAHWQQAQGIIWRQRGAGVSGGHCEGALAAVWPQFLHAL